MRFAEFSDTSNVINDSGLVDISGVEGIEYNIDLDDESEELISEYVNENNLAGNDLEAVEAAYKSVLNDFDHVTTLSRENRSPEEDLDELKAQIDQERRESQGTTPSKIQFSNVLNGKYDGSNSDIVEENEEGYLAGGCVERSIMMSYVLEELGFDAELKMGQVRVREEHGREAMYGHAWTQILKNGDFYIVDPSSSTEADVEKWTDVQRQYRESQFGIAR